MKSKVLTVALTVGMVVMGGMEDIIIKIGVVVIAGLHLLLLVV
jgi:hypothetical protein